MARPTKTFGVTVHNRGLRTPDGKQPGQLRAIVQATSQQAAVDAINAIDGLRVTRYDLTNYGSVTGNSDEIALAGSRPGEVFLAPTSHPLRYLPADAYGRQGDDHE